MAPNKKEDCISSTERFFYEVSASIQAAAELASRNDERVNMIMGQIQKIEAQIEKTNEILQTVSSRLSLIESQDFESIYDELNDLSKNLAVLESLKSNEDIDELYDEIQEINLKLSNAHNEIQNVLNKMTKQENNWSKFFDYFWKAALTIIIAYILYLLGINSP